MSLRLFHPSLSDEERQCVLGRIAINVVILALLSLTAPLLASPRWVGVACAIVVTACTLYVLRCAATGRVKRAMKIVLLPDLLVLAALTYHFRLVDDGFYPMALMLGAVYALVLERKWSWVAGIASGLAYVVGHAIEHTAFDSVHLVVFSFKTLAIPTLAATVGAAVELHRRHREQAFAAAKEREVLNARLERRIGELQAVRRITEMLHSSLDVDEVGADVLGVLAETMGISACCAFVIDKDERETVFSVSHGMKDDERSAVEGLDWAGADAHFTCTPIFDHGGTIVLFCSLAEEIERISDEDRLVLGAIASELVVAVENSRLYKLTRTMADTDELTGLHNYRYLQQRLDEEIERGRRYGGSVSLLMIDLDDFKGFNDRHGHLAGDEALAEFGRVVGGVIREVDLLARYGGEEFSVLLPETDASGAFIAAEKIREAVAHHDFSSPVGAATCSLTVSVGLATYPSHALDKEQLLHKADDALYTAKTGGRNRVRAPRPAEASPGDRLEAHTAEGGGR